MTGLASGPGHGEICTQTPKAERLVLATRELCFLALAPHMPSLSQIARWLLLPFLACELCAQPDLLAYDESKPAPVVAEPSAVVTASGEGVWLQRRRNEIWHPLRSGDSLPLGALLMTDANSGAVVELPTGHGVVQVGRNSVIELAARESGAGTVLVLTSGRVSGGISDTLLEIVSSCGGGLTVTAPPGITAPFEFRHGRDARHQAALSRLGLTADWARFIPSDANLDSVFGLGAAAPVASADATTTPETWALLIVGSVTLGLVLRQRG